VRFTRVDPGIAPDADAWNLIVASAYGDRETAEQIAAGITDWIPVASYLAGYAAIVWNKINETNPEVADCIAEMLNAKYRVSELV
jgi:hypothetical protein